MKFWQYKRLEKYSKRKKSRRRRKRSSGCHHLNTTRTKHMGVTWYTCQPIHSTLTRTHWSISIPISQMGKLKLRAVVVQCLMQTVVWVGIQLGPNWLCNSKPSWDSMKSLWKKASFEIGQLKEDIIFCP